MEPYRSAGVVCPTCTESPLREFQGRLICDECSGLLITEEDYASSCSDLGSGDVNLRFAGDTATTHACPRCERSMTKTEVVLEPLRILAHALRCERHGLWITDDELTGVFARIRRRTGFHNSRYYAMGRSAGRDGIAARTGPATAGLAISEWHNRPRRRTQTVSPINLYRDQPLPCPVCPASPATHLRFFGDRYACQQCGGTFVQNAALASMVMDVSKQLWDVPLPTGAAGPRACPVCQHAMLVEDLERVPIDRCAEHGVWFDLNELTVALENASHQFEAHGVRAWLKKLFA
jgi:Zn-finger nucleic acid-binding protein